MATISPVAARSLSAIWYVTHTGDDGADGDVNTHRGSLRFTLAHAQNGDFVSFANFDRVVDIIDVFSTLTVPAGVAVGHTRDQPCGSVMSPLVNIRAQSGVTVVVSLGADTTLRNFDVAGGTISVKATGANVDVCGVGLGFMHDETDGLLPSPPATAAFIVDGLHAVLHQSWVNNTIIVSQRGSDTQIGDAIGGSVDSNQGACGNQGKCPVSVLADQTSAAQRVTIRDVFPRGLLGLVGSGILGGDDVITHTNNWVKTPVIASALSSDNFASVVVKGQANPNSLVDIFFDDGALSLARQTPVTADASGAFAFTGALPGSNINVIAISTLNDSAFPGRMGSSSQWSGPVQVTMDSSGGATPTATQTAVTKSTPTQTSTPTTPVQTTATTPPTPSKTSPSNTTTATITPTPTKTGTPSTQHSPTPSPTPTQAEPEIELEHAAWGFTGPPSNTIELEQSVSITFPRGYENTPWTTSITTTDGLHWLSATSGGKGNGVLVIRANPVGLATGFYQGSVVINPASISRRMMGLKPASIAISFSIFNVKHRLYLPIILR